jgi:DnaJ-class molecular chaperone
VATHLKIIERDCVKKLTPYEWLLVSRDVSEDALKVAFKKVCLVLHPDKVEVELRSLAQSCFVEMKKSYDLIRTPELRKNYDRFTMGPFHQHYNDYDPYEDEEDGEEMFYDMDQAAFMFFARQAKKLFFFFFFFFGKLICKIYSVGSRRDLRRAGFRQDLRKALGDSEDITTTATAGLQLRATAQTGHARDVVDSTDETAVPDTKSPRDTRQHLFVKSGYYMFENSSV